jgi:cell division protein FtsQ
VRATAVAVPPSVRRFNSRARARRIRSARPWLVAAAVLIVLGGAAYIGFGTSVIGVTSVEVRGAGFVGATAIRDAAAIRRGTPLLGLDTRAVAHRVQTLVGVAHADVSRHLPSTVVIDVRVRTAVAAVPMAAGSPAASSTGPSAGSSAGSAAGSPATGSKATGSAHTAKPTAYRLVDATGVAFRTVPAVPAGVAVVDLAAPGPDDPSTRAALSVLAALPPALRDRLDHISAATSAEIQLTLTDGRAIVWGDATDNATKARVAETLLRRGGKVIDVSAPNLVTVR